MLFSSLRPSHWIKNILVFTALVVSHSYQDPEKVTKALSAFVIFCMSASAVYLLNDFLDKKYDRSHSIKRLRPIASGEISTFVIWLMLSLLLVVSLVLSHWLLNNKFIFILITYLALTTIYSTHLKRIAILDIILLSFFYNLRILAGAYAISVEPTSWLLSFSLFFFTSLALMKRFNEIFLDEQQSILNSRGYQVDDKPFMSSFGIASAIASVVVLAFYINDTHASEMYHTPEIIWALCPILLYWTMRMWLLSLRGRMTEDSILFAIKDPTSLVCGLLTIITLVMARIVI